MNENERYATKNFYLKQIVCREREREQERKRAKRRIITEMRKGLEEIGEEGRIVNGVQEKRLRVEVWRILTVYNEKE